MIYIKENCWAYVFSKFQVKSLGYKSVAHYLIYTQRGQAKTDVASAESPLAIDDEKEGSSDVLTQLDAEKNEKAENNLKLDSDEEFRGDEYEDEDEDEDEDGSQWEDESTIEFWLLI